MVLSFYETESKFDSKYTKQKTLIIKTNGSEIFSTGPAARTLTLILVP